MRKLFLILFFSLITYYPAMAQTNWNSYVDLTWNQNPESDLASYKIYYGLSSGHYTSGSLDVGVTNTPASPAYKLDVGALCGSVESIFIVITAFDTKGNESKPSKEVSKSFDLPPCAPTATRILP